MWGNQGIGIVYYVLHVYNFMDSALTDWYIYTAIGVEGAGGGVPEKGMFKKKLKGLGGGEVLISIGAPAK